MPEMDQVKAALASLADREGDSTTVEHASASTDDYQQVIDRAVAARQDIDLATTFLEDVGLVQLDRAIETAEQELSSRAADGREVRSAFEQYREVARDNHFHRARDTSLGGAGVRHDK